jgi:hypothetical protein
MKMGSCCNSLSPSILNVYQTYRFLQNPDARWLWIKQTHVDHTGSVVVVEAEEDPMDVVWVEVEVTVT